MTDLTPYLEVHTTAEVPGADEPVRIAGVIKAEMIGAPPDRSGAVLRSFLDSEDAMVRYLRFLLDEDGAPFTFGDVIAAHSADDERRGGPRRARFEDMALLEPLLRAAAGGSDVLSRVEGLLRDLGADRDDPGGLPEDFLHIWDAIWTATTQGQGVDAGERDE